MCERRSTSVDAKKRGSADGSPILAVIESAGHALAAFLAHEGNRGDEWANGTDSDDRAANTDELPNGLRFDVTDRADNVALNPDGNLAHHDRIGFRPRPQCTLVEGDAETGEHDVGHAIQPTEGLSKAAEPPRCFTIELDTATSLRLSRVESDGRYNLLVFQSGKHIVSPSETLVAAVRLALSTKVQGPSSKVTSDGLRT